MPKLTMWIARCRNDSSSYDIRTKTRKEALRLIDEHWETGTR